MRKRLGCGCAACLVAILLLVWTSAQLAGLLVNGSWPQVAMPWPVVEVVRLLGGEAPVDGFPLALFWHCLLLEAAAGGLVGVGVTRWLRTRRHHWEPPPPEWISHPQPFLASYRRRVREDQRKPAAAPPQPAAPPVAPDRPSLPAPSLGFGLPDHHRTRPLDIEGAARVLVEHFSTDDLHALIGELAKRALGGDQGQR